MENLDVSQKELESIKSKFKYWGYESSLYEASEKSLYKIFINMPIKKIRNKKKKIELLYDMQIPIFRNPIRTLSEEGRFIGYEIENYREEFTTLFNESGKEVIKCIAKQKRKKKVEPLYLIDNLKKVS